MTTIVRRKPKKLVLAQEIRPRVTTGGKVSSLPSPIQALWAEAVGRSLQLERAELDWDEGVIVGGEVEGLCVAIAVLWCQPLEQVRVELERRVVRVELAQRVKNARAT